MPKELPGPAADYDLQLVQLPLQFVLTDRVVWANRFSQPAFQDGEISAAVRATADNVASRDIF
jgi:hypothetical protein